MALAQDTTQSASNLRKKKGGGGAQEFAAPKKQQQRKCTANVIQGGEARLHIKWGAKLGSIRMHFSLLESGKIHDHLTKSHIKI